MQGWLLFSFAAFLSGLSRRFFGSGATSINVIERGSVAARHISERFRGSFFHNLNYVLHGRFDLMRMGITTEVYARVK